jgi:hypothetical protein
MNDRNAKQVTLKEGTNKRWRVNEEGKGGRLWLMYFLYMYEYGRLKPDEVHLSKVMW